MWSAPVHWRCLSKSLHELTWVLRSSIRVIGRFKEASFQGYAESLMARTGNDTILGSPGTQLAHQVNNFREYAVRMECGSA